ncbi:MAG: hypothetical protein Q9220_001804 [cf. Caloplaca sp. 1 TL-2023]
MTANFAREVVPLGQDGDRRSELYGSLATFLVINNVVIVSRIWAHCRTHYRARRSILLEDVFALISALCVNAVIGNLLASTHYGLGLHATDINSHDLRKPHNLADTFKHVWITMVLQGPTFTAIKLSLLFLYRRLFLVHQKWLRIAWWANLVYIVLWAFGATGFYLFQCWPVGWYWNRYYERFQTDPPYTGGTGQCNATTVQHVATPLIFGLVSDVALLCLPITAILKLQITNRKKIGLAAIFGVGILACLLELARIVQLFEDTDDKTDPSYGVVIFLILSVAEEVCAILCGSLPVVFPILYQQYKNRPAKSSAPLSSSQRKSKSNSNNSGSRFTSKFSAAVPALGSLGKGFGKLDEDSESSVELKSHGGHGGTMVSNDRSAGGWPFDNSNAASYTVAAAKTPATGKDVVDEERDIVVRKEVHVTAVGGGGGVEDAHAAGHQNRNVV